MADCTGEEEDHDDGCSDPDGTVEVGGAVESVEEGCGVGEEREKSGTTAVQDRCGVDVEVLGVEG